MITRRTLSRALARARVADWVIVERAQEVITLDEARGRERRERRTRFELALHHDAARGRGSARVTITGGAGDADAVVGDAVALAAAAIGPAWKSPPPAAPARVVVLAPDLGPLDDAAARIALGAHEHARGTGASVGTLASALREDVEVVASSGLHADWPASELRLDAVVANADRVLEVARAARTHAGLALAAAIGDATRDLGELGGAAPIAAGRYDLVLGADALLPAGGLGVWQVFADQADSTIERQGLTRYRPGAPIAPGAGDGPEPLSIASDGARDLMLRSAPLGADGGAVRRFPLVERGVAVGLALTPREAALRRAEPNGGIRNLVVAAGTWDGRPPPRPTLEVRRLRALAIDPITGDATLELALAIAHRDGRSTAVRGGAVRLDLIAALAGARRSATTIARGGYVGPDAVWIEGVDVTA